jgi:hypothetical protein
MGLAGLVTPVVGLAVSLLVSVAAWVYLDSLVLFLFLPIVPVVARRLWGTDDGDDRVPRQCPPCDVQTTDPAVAYCPRDGTTLGEA